MERERENRSKEILKISNRRLLQVRFENDKEFTQSEMCEIMNIFSEYSANSNSVNFKSFYDVCVIIDDKNMVDLFDEVDRWIILHKNISYNVIINEDVDAVH